MATNPFSGIITSTMKTMHENAIKALLEDSAGTVSCRLYYGDTRFTQCPNCYYNPQTKMSSGRYKPGGPIEFTIGICPYCHGLGKKEVAETTSTLSLMPIWNSREWVDFVIPKDRPDVGTPDSLVQTMCEFKYYTDIMKAKHILIDTDIEDYTKRFYEKLGEPKPCGFGKSAFIFQMWSRTDK